MLRIYCFDSDVVIDFLNQQDYAKKLVRGLIIESHILTLPSVAVAEIIYGYPEHKMDEIYHQLKNIWQIHSISGENAIQAAKWQRKYQSKGVQLHIDDLLIAASTLSQNALLVTRNTKHYPMSEIQLYNLHPSD